MCIDYPETQKDKQMFLLTKFINIWLTMHVFDWPLG